MLFCLRKTLLSIRFKDRTCVQDEEISKTKHRWLLSSETQTAAESWRLLNFMVLLNFRGRLYAYPEQP